jgi:hypothetical protein
MASIIGRLGLGPSIPSLLPQDMKKKTGNISAKIRMYVPF